MGWDVMLTHKNLYTGLCSFNNMFLAYKRARKHKTLKSYVIEFEKNLAQNLSNLCIELQNKTYSPKPLINFTVRDPKTRKISKSDFRDRIVHHALCNIIEPIFERTFIHDSYANRVGKGTLKAVERFEHFKRKSARNNSRPSYVLKADIKHYFENVNHKVLLTLLRKRINDKDVIWLVEQILNNHSHFVGGGATAIMECRSAT